MITTSTRTYGSLPRVGAGFLIGIAHLGLLLALVRYAQKAFEPDSAPVSSMAVTFVPAFVAPAAPPAAASVPTSTPPAREKAPAPSRASSRSVQEPSAPASQPVADAPVTAAPAAPAPVAAPVSGATPRLDMDAVRQAARQAARERVPTALERVREAELHRDMDDNDTARAIKKTARPDCRTAYGGGTKANLFILIPLAIDTITDHGCKW